MQFRKRKRLGEYKKRQQQQKKEEQQTLFNSITLTYPILLSYYPYIVYILYNILIIKI